MKAITFAMTLVASQLAGILSAATIDGLFSGNASATNTYDLSTLGTVDWAYWDETSSTSLPGDPTNEKSGGALIGNIYGVGTVNTVRGPSSRTSLPTMRFMFSDGASNPSGVVTNPVGLFNSAATAAISNGVGLVIDLPTTNTYQITVFVSGYGGAAGRFTASLNGATDYVSTNYLDISGGSNDSAFYTLYVKPDTAGDDLTVKFVLAVVPQGFDIVNVNGVAVSLAPPVSIEGSFSGNATATGTYDLTALGAEDWLFWRTGSSGGTPSNSKSGGALISDAFIVGTGTSLGRPSTNTYNTTFTFTYSNGTVPASDTVIKPSGVYNGSYNIVSNGVGVSVKLPTVDTYIVSVFVSGFQTGGKFTADLPGAPQYGNTDFQDDGGLARDCSIYTLRAMPRTAGDELTIKFVQYTDSSKTVEFTIIAGVAVRLAPPKGTLVWLQ